MRNKCNKLLTTLLWNCCIVHYFINGNPEKFCELLSKKKEPDVLIYNRVPKCASTSMTQLMELMPNVVLFTSPPYFWDELDSDIKKRHLLVDQSLKLLNNQKKRLIITGHFSQTTFTEFGKRTYEFINVIRECTSRRISEFFYHLFDSVAAHEAVNHKEFVQKIIHNASLNACLSDDHCCSHLRLSTNEMRFFCGKSCESKAGSKFKGNFL